MASWARRSFAADTIFMALVIFWVDWILTIRRLISLRVGKGQAASSELPPRSDG